MTKFQKLFESSVQEAKLSNLDTLAQKVWSTKDLEQKREALISMISKMKGKPAQTKYTAEAKELTTGEAMDKLASNLMLSDTNKLV